MSDMSPEEAARFDAAHARLMALANTSDIQALVAKLVGGILTMKQFLAALFALPSVRAIVEEIDAGAGAGVALLVAGSGPVGAFVSPAAGALTTLALNAIAGKLGA